MRNLKRFIKISLVCLAIFIVAIVYSVYIEPKLIKVNNYTVKTQISENNKKDNVEKLKIVQFTDTQLGEFFSIEQLEKVVSKINKLNPDIIVFTGDLIDDAKNYEDLNKVSGVLKKLKASQGKFAIFGNHDYGGSCEWYYRGIMENSQFKVLKNQKHTINLPKGKKLTIFGLDDIMLGSANIKKTMMEINKNNFNLLLVHEPDLADKFNSYDVDLALAGHSHGGQVRLPFIGSLKTPKYAKKYTSGFYDLNNNRNGRLYVSTGLGNTKMPFRFLNVPEIVLFEMEF